MSSTLLSTVVLLALSALVASSASAVDEDFGFDGSDDVEVEIESSSRKLWSHKEITANVGKAFHLVIPKEAFGTGAQSYEAKRLGGKHLPLWLLFDKSGGVFWGVPLPEDVDTLNIVVKSVGNGKNASEELTIRVTDTTSDSKKSPRCPSAEDDTVLTLLIDRGVRTIKPKQRVVALNNIAKFFGLPLSAFTLKNQVEKDDITDSSVVLAGPGNLRTRQSKLTSLLQVPVGCDGRLWMQTAQLVHQLKQQARDGTIAEVIGLPIIGWRVKTETKPVIRARRQAPADDYGSGDAGDYEDEYYDDNNYDDDEYDEDTGGSPPETSAKPKATTRASTTTTTTTTTTPSPVSVTHPHRHHHGEAINPEDVDFSIPVIREHHRQESSPRNNEYVPDGATLPMIPVERSTTSTSTTTTTPSTTTTTPTTTTTRPTTPRETTLRTVASTARRIVATEATTPKIDINPNALDEDYYAEYDDDEDDDDEDSEGPIESKTTVPDLAVAKHHFMPEFFPHNETTSHTPRTTVTEVKLETIIPTASTITEDPTMPDIVDDTEPPVIVTTETTVPTIPVTTTFTSTTTSTTTTARTTTTTTTEAATTPTTTTSTTTTTTTIAPSTTITTPIPLIPTVPERTTTEAEEEASTVKLTTIRHIISTPRTTTIREITDAIEYDTKNFKPYIENRLQQKSVIAGKIFRFVIPFNTFKDVEDGHNLTLEFLNSKEEPVPRDSWIHFNPARREIYGLPLEEDVSKYDYVLRATDRDGDFVQDRLTIQVQQHKLQRVVNHEFSLYIRIEKHQEFPHFADWCLRIVQALGRIYDTNASEITVRHVNYTTEPAVFIWTNDSIPTTEICPEAEIDELFKILTANDRGDPSRELNNALAPELRVKKVVKEGVGVCKKRPEILVTPPINYPPFLRNPVDHINATVGELLVFKVPPDTFYDPEDTDPNTLNITLLTADRQAIKPHHWLQFDNKNKEFYGIPRKIGRSEYHLVCMDSAGSMATDSLEIVVYSAPKMAPNVEFSMTIETPYDTFVSNAALQRKFVEKIQRLYGDRNPNHIHVNPFQQKRESTVVTWFNKSLTTEKCPRLEIAHLESKLRNHDRGIASSVITLMEPDFPVSTIMVQQLGNCRANAKSAQPEPRPPVEDVIPIDEGVPVDESIPVDDGVPKPNSEKYQYLMTFIVPVVIILIMLFLAAIAACVLYRRRRTGKMNVEEDSRQSYGNKGIPVIFQEELEEKPESGTKAPVILQDEKPPLAPPEYSKSGSLKLNNDDTAEPYQPPPPFTRTQDNGRQPRPKPTPTYRKPPPF